MEMWCARGSRTLEILQAWLPWCEDPEVIRLLREAEAMEPKRLKLIRQADARIASLQPASFLFRRMGMDAMSSRVRLPFPMPRLGTVPGLWKLRHASVTPDGG